MKCNLTFCLFESFSLFFWEVLVKILMTSDNQTVCIPSFVLAVFWCSTSYTVIIVLWKMLMEPVNAHARWWPCACLKFVFGLRRLKKTLSFLRCIHIKDLVLKYGSNINEGNWLQLLFYFIVLIGMVASVIGISFFSYVSGFGSKFSRIASWRKRLLCKWFSKVIWPRMDWFWGFLLGKGFFRQLHICIDWNRQELLSC